MKQRGLHTCKPQNTPRVGEIKEFLVIDMGTWTKIKSRKPDEGGNRYTILTVEKTDWVDSKYGNVSFNLEIEPVGSGTASAPMRDQADKSQGAAGNSAPSAPPPYADVDPGYDPRYRQNPTMRAANQDDPRHHIMRSANLYCLCMDAANHVVIKHLQEKCDIQDAATAGEIFQKAVAALFIEASGRRTDDGINWWSYIDKMTTVPMKTKEEPVPPKEDEYW